MTLPRLPSPFASHLRILHAYPRQRQRHASVLSIRAQSTASASVVAAKSPSSKIEMVPFAVGLEDVEIPLKMAAMLSAPSFSNIFYGMCLKFFGERFTSFFKEFGLTGSGMTHLTTRAILYPTWRYHYIAEGLLKKDGKGSMTKLSLKDSTIPGNSFSPLSLLYYSHSEIPSPLPKFDPSKHLTQFDNPVSALPYNVSALTVADGLKQELSGRVEWEEAGLTVDVGKDWKDMLLAVYPVYFPIYLSEWECKRNNTKPRRITVGIFAHDAENLDKVFIPRPAAMFRTSNISPYWFIHNFAIDIGLQISPTSKSISAPEMMLAGGSLTKHIDEYFSPRVTEDLIDMEEQTVVPPKSPLEKYEGDVDWSDERIMNWSSVAKEENDVWFEEVREFEGLKVQSEIFTMLRSETRRLSGKESDLKIEGSTEKWTLTEARDVLANKVRKRGPEVAANKPSWWKAWEKKQSAVTKKRR